MHARDRGLENLVRNIPELQDIGSVCVQGLCWAQQTGNQPVTRDPGLDCICGAGREQFALNRFYKASL